MTEEEYIECLKEAFGVHPNLVKYISDGIEKNSDRNIEKFINNNSETFYERCFRNACFICKNDVDLNRIAYIDVASKKYDASTKNLSDSTLIEVDSSFYASFIVYFQCLYFWSYIDSDENIDIDKLLRDEVELHINAINLQSYIRKTDATQFIDFASKDDDIILWAAISAECLTTFLILHEIGHIHLKHDSLRQKLGKKIYFKRYKRFCELEADTYAAKKLYELMKANNTLKKPTLDFINVPYLFFKFLDFIDRYSVIKLGNNTFVPSHYPKLKQRLSNIGYQTEYGYQLFEKPNLIIDDLMSLYSLH